MLSLSLRELAADLGLDVSTVSRGLRGSKRVAAATRQRICERAAVLGYQPDPALARLSRRRWAGKRAPRHLNLAFLVSFRRDSRLFFETAQAMAGHLGYVLRLIALADFSDTDALQQYLIGGGFEGILLSHLQDLPVLPALDWSRFAVVACGDGAFEVPFHRVVADTYQQMQVALEQAWAAGYRRPGVVTLPLVLDNDRRRLAALRMFRERHRLARLPDCTVDYVPDETDRKRYLAWHTRHRPDVVLLPHAKILRGLLPERSTRPPCAVLSEQGDVRGLAHVYLGLDNVGRIAVQQLSHALHHRLLGIPEVAVCSRIRPVWVPGASLLGGHQSARSSRECGAKPEPGLRSSRLGGGSFGGHLA